MGLSAGIGALVGTLRGLNRRRKEQELLVQKDFETTFDRIEAQIRIVLSDQNADPQARQQALAQLSGELDEAEKAREKALKAASPFRKIAGLFGVGKKKEATAEEGPSPEDIVSGTASPEALIPQGEGTGAEFGQPDADIPPVGGMPVEEETQTFPGGGPGAAVAPAPPEFGPGQRGVQTLSGLDKVNRAVEQLRAFNERIGPLSPGQQVEFESQFGGRAQVVGVTLPTSREQLAEQTSGIALVLIDPNSTPEEKQTATEALRRLGAAERAEPQEPNLAGAFQAAAFAVVGKIISTREEFEALSNAQKTAIQKKMGQERPPSAASESFALTQKVGKVASSILNEVRQALLPGPTGQPQIATAGGIELTKVTEVTDDKGRKGRTRVPKTPEELAIEIIQNRSSGDAFIREHSAALENAVRRLLQTQGGGEGALAEFLKIFGPRQ